MPLPRDQAWFAAKQYGYGWSLPLRWQGWLVLLGYIAAIVAAGFAFAYEHHTAFIALGILLSVTLVGVCYWKGEKPMWRWGR
jgi:hypothetical protein